jgi:hypothetical protein
MSLMLAVLLLAADPTPAPAEPAAKPAKVAEKKICKVDPEQTGTRFRARICLTETEWEMRAQGKSGADLKTLGAH